MTLDTTTWKCGPPPANGQKQRYPGRFEYNLRKYYPELLSDRTLHMFSGSCAWGITTDFRPETGAQIVAPYDAIPLADGSVDNVIADPPYADHYQGEWVGMPNTDTKTGLPKPKRILGEAARLTRPGGLIAILHIIIIPAYAEFGVTRIAIHPILAGPNNALRTLNVFQVKK
jgi:hypothetical protein